MTERERETYKGLVKQHAVGDEVAIPSIKDGLPFLNLHTDIEFDKIITEQMSEIKQAAARHGLSIAPRRAVTVLIPLTSYLPLPKPYTAALLSKTNIAKKQVEEFTCVRIEDYLPRMTVTDDVLLKLSYAIVTIGSLENGTISTNLDKQANLLDIHGQAIQAINKVIDAYKATPRRHNHLLQPITQLGSPGHIYALVFNTKHGNIKSAKEIDVHGHLFGEMLAARTMAEDELSVFREIHVRNAVGEGFPLRLVKKLNEAIDARCMGRNETAIMAADLYAEQAMSYWLYRILLEKGETEVDAKKKSRGFKEITNLKNILAKELGHDQAAFDKLLKYNRWYQLCREKRNSLAHDFQFEGDSGKMSYQAVQESARLIKIIAETAADTYPNLYKDGQIFWAATWMLEMTKHSDWEK